MLLALIAAASAAPDLSPLKPLLDACWRAELAPSVDDTHCFEPMYGGAHVRDRHEVRQAGKTVYAGETIYSVEGAEVVFTYVNSLGGVGRGKMRRGSAALIFTGTMRAMPDKAEQAIDSTWRLLDQGYEVRSLVAPKDGEPSKPLTFRRVAEAPK